MKNIWQKADKLLEEYKNRNSDWDEPEDLDDFAIEALAEEPIDTLLSERGLTREQALSKAKAERDTYNALAERLGIESREFPWLWIELIGKCESDLTEDSIELLLWLTVGGSFSDDTDDFTEREAEDFAIRRYIGVKDRAAELKNYFNDLHEKLSEFAEIIDQINSIKTFKTGSSDETDVERVFSVMCENDFAEKCDNRELFYNNLEMISQMINKYDFLKPIKPLVYFHTYVRQQNKLLNKDGFIPNLKKLFEERNYGILENNEKNFKQYAEYCRLYILLKGCFPDADEKLCDTGFMCCSNLANWYHELGYMDYTCDLPEGIPFTPYEVIREMGVFCFDESMRPDSPGKLKKWRKRYHSLYIEAIRVVENIRFEELGDFAELGEKYCQKFFSGEFLELVTSENHDAAWGLLVYETERRFDELLEYKIFDIFDKYYIKA